MRLRTASAACALAAANALAFAAPVRLDYQKTDVGSGQFQYDFTLTLDNHDGSWTPGQGWDWFVIGASDEWGTYKSFNTTGTCDFSAVDWLTVSHDPQIKEIGAPTCGGVRGATLMFHHWGGPIEDWYWTPELGDTVSFSATSSVDFLEGELRWSAIWPDGGARAINFEQANQRPAVIPEPGSLALLGLAMAGLALARRRH
jgi:hypothetical protein